MNWNRSFQIEMDIQRIISEQAHYGVYFNEIEARELVCELTRKMDLLEKMVLRTFSMDLEIPYKQPVLKPFLKNGNYSKSVRDWYDDEQIRSTVGGPFSRVRWVRLALSKRQRVCNQLLKLGWKPTFRTEKGAPQIVKNHTVCPALHKVAGRVGKDLSTWYTYSHRRSQVEGWLSHLRSDSRLSASAIVNGTNTGRMTHRLVVNVPKAADHVIYGKEMRRLFTVPEGKSLLGVDAAGLELRMLCHYMNDKDYTEKLLHDDIHGFNQRLAGLPDRDSAKTFIYAFLYGAGDNKLGSIVGGSTKEGRELRARFLKGLPSLESLTSGVIRASRRGWLRGIDDRRVFMRRDSRGNISTHKALNTLLQSTGSIVMKMAAIIFDRMSEGYNCHMVLNMHDEFQVEVLDADVSVIKNMMEDSIKLAGEFFELRIPLEGECIVGLTWAETH